MLSFRLPLATKGFRKVPWLHNACSMDNQTFTQVQVFTLFHSVDVGAAYDTAIATGMNHSSTILTAYSMAAWRKAVVPSGLH